MRLTGKALSFSTLPDVYKRLGLSISLFFFCVCISSGQQKGVNQKAPRSTAALKYAHTRSSLKKKEKWI